MKKNKFIKIISVFMSFLIFSSSIVSCTTSDDLQTKEYNKKMNVNDIKSIHEKIKNEVNGIFDDIKNSDNTLVTTFNRSNKSIEELEDNFKVNFEEDLEYNQTYGDKALFKKYNLNIDILNAFKWLKLNELKENNLIYENLLDKFELNENEIYYLFVYLELYKNLNKNENYKLNSSFDFEYSLRTTPCEDAVLNTLMVTAIFTGVVIFSGGAGLPAAVGFLAGKAWSMRGLYKNC
ncbi:hypothetical protein [Myroides odoratimimus]|uniref:hypothetical protein n=2 Tax=Myroides odoratimimus TaxID=76832 RepID=UPI0025749C20|nr:hypothetical protein [Myroides odoratimimus]MDM1060899.1 hypothetical protein [Myroides odoratimimus]MDM1086835.1 hypothetical protein [Myroides odoratimimus]